MALVKALLAALAALAVLYVLSLRGRTRHPLLPQLMGHAYTHRGLFDNEAGVPENSLAAFRRTAAHPGFGCEFDVHLTRDGQLVVIHDSDLRRACGRQGNVEELTLAQLQQCTLFGTGETIPTLEQVLAVLAPAEAPLVVELKCFGNNAAPLARATVEALRSYPAPYCLESFDPRALLWLRRNAPALCRGQLSCNFLRDRNGLSLPVALCLTLLMENFLTRPDFIAYKFEDRRCLGPRLAAGLWHIAQFRWTIRTQADMDTASAENCASIFEHFLPRKG